MYLSTTCFWNLTDVTLADEDTNSIQTDDANKVIQGNMAMQVAPPGGQICNWNIARVLNLKLELSLKLKLIQI